MRSRMGGETMMDGWERKEGGERKVDREVKGKWGCLVIEEDEVQRREDGRERS